MISSEKFKERMIIKDSDSISTAQKMQEINQESSGNTQ